MESSTRELTRAIAAGDSRALEALYRSHFDLLHAFIRRTTRRDESFCLDIIHDTMLRVIRSIPVLESGEALDGWLRVTALSCARDRLRADGRRARRESLVSREPRGGASDEESSEFASLHLVEAAIARLDPAAAGLVLARYRFGWTLARIGASLGLKPGAVDGRLSRALAQIRRQLEEAADG